MNHILASLALAAFSSAAAQAQSDWTYLECDLEQRWSPNSWTRPAQLASEGMAPSVIWFFRIRTAPAARIDREYGDNSGGAYFHQWHRLCGPIDPDAPAYESGAAADDCLLADQYIRININRSFSDGSNDRTEDVTLTIDRTTLWLEESQLTSRRQPGSDSTPFYNGVWRDGVCEVIDDPAITRRAPPPPERRF